MQYTSNYPQIYQQLIKTKTCERKRGPKTENEFYCGRTLPENMFTGGKSQCKECSVKKTNHYNAQKKEELKKDLERIDLLSKNIDLIKLEVREEIKKEIDEQVEELKSNLDFLNEENLDLNREIQQKELLISEKDLLIEELRKTIKSLESDVESLTDENRILNKTKKNGF